MGLKDINWKEFLKPTKKKVLLALVLFALPFLPVLPNLAWRFFQTTTPIFYQFGFILLPVYLAFYITYPLLFSAVGVIEAVLIFASSYLTICFAEKTKGLIKKVFFGLIGFIAFIWIFGICLTLAVGLYNDIFSRPCSANSDCSWWCDPYAHNGLYIHLYDPFTLYDCFTPATPICEKNRCEAVLWNEAKSLQECNAYLERCNASGNPTCQNGKDSCLFHLALYGDKNACNLIEAVGLRDYCKSETPK